jgi:hypothetical protein
MNKSLIKHNTQIAIALLASSLRDRYWNGNITHSQRNFITSTALEILERVLLDIEESDVLSIPKSPSNINLPEES